MSVSKVGWRGEIGTRAAVATEVLLLHVGFYHLLDQFAGESNAPRSASDALQASFIAPPPKPVLVSLPEVPRQEPPSASRTRAEAEPVSLPRASGPGSRAPTGAATAEPRRALQLQWRRAELDDAGFPLAPAATDQDELLPPAPPGRFRMRRQLTGKDVIEGTAKALGLWPEGYTTDPCPRIKRNIHGLMTDGGESSRRLLAEELRRQRQSCGG